MSADHASQFLAAVATRRVLVIGDVMLDRYVNGEVTRVSPEDPTCLVLDHMPPVERKLGGAANVASNIAALGASVDLIGLGGDRKFSDQFQATVKTASEVLPGRLQCHLSSASSRRFTVKTRYCAHGKQLLRVDSGDQRIPSAEETKQLKQLYTDAVERITEPAPDIVILSDYGKGTLLDDLGLFDGACFLTWLLDRLQRDKLRYVVDPKRNDVEAYGAALVLCPNQHEWASICGAGHKSLATHIVVTAGAQGCILMPWRDGQRLSQGSCQQFPVEPAAIGDPTGAGDTFIATLALALACQLPISVACELANAAARRAVMGMGTVTVSAEELREDLCNE